MLELKKTPEHTIDRVFLLALLALFAATAFLVVSIGAKQYHSIADSMTANYETRTVSSYLEEKMNQNDVREYRPFLHISHPSVPFLPSPYLRL